MPELPEVETTVRGLQKEIVGATIESVWCKTFSNSPLNKNTHKNKEYFLKLQSAVTGTTIEKVGRRAKYIDILCANNLHIVIHLRMTGHLIVGSYKLVDEEADTWPWVPVTPGTPTSDPFNRHIRVVFTLRKEGELFHLVFCDSRKFGTIEFRKGSEINSMFNKLGPEPLLPSFTKEVLRERLSSKGKSPIKGVLLDQKVLAGVGNIYSDEALHLAHLHPLRPASSLSEKEIGNLFEALQKVLTLGVSFGGDSMSDYRNVYGEKGAFQGKHLVYLRHGKKCLLPDCLGTIMKIQTGGRGAHFCDTCQK